MIPKKIKAQNFLSYELLEIEFNKNLCLIDGWNYDENTGNGAGKTGLLDAISFCLYGQIPREIKVDEVINRRAKKNCVIEFEFDNYKVIRSRKPNDLVIIKDGKEIRGKDQKETQQILENILKIDFNIFVNSVYFTQNAKSRFISATDNEKKEILTKVLDLSIFDRAYKETHNKINRLSEKINKLEYDAGHFQSQITFNEQDIKKYEQKSKLFDEEKTSKINKIKERINIDNKQIEKNENEIRDSKSERINIIAQLAKIEGKLNLKEDINDRIKKAQRIHTELNTEYISENKKLQKLMSSDEGECSECFQKITKDHLEKEISKLTSKLKSLLPKVDEAFNKSKEMEHILNKFTELEREKSELHNKFNRLENEEKGLKNLIERIERDIEDKKEEIIEIKNEKNSYAEIIETVTDKLKNNLEDLKSVEEETKILNEFKDKLEVLKNSYKNIKYYVFESVVEDLSSRIDKYLESLFKNSVKVELRTDSTNSKGELVQKFRTKIIKDEQEVSFNSLSDGEKKRIEIATNFALSDVILNSSNGINLLVLDEIFNGLCNEGRQQVVYLLELLKEEKNNIFIIDHFESTKGMVDDIIRVEKRDRISKIV